jgi:hypothetical protein
MEGAEKAVSHRISETFASEKDHLSFRILDIGLHPFLIYTELCLNGLYNPETTDPKIARLENIAALNSIGSNELYSLEKDKIVKEKNNY